MAESCGRSPAVEPLLRGVAYAAMDGVAYPRADLTDDRLPVDTRRAATIPAGVRLEFEGDAEAVDIDYVPAGDTGAPWSAASGTTFASWCGGRARGVVAAQAAGGRVRLAVGDGAADDIVTVYLPERMRPTVLDVRAVGGAIAPVPVTARWLCYGDSITEGWCASDPAYAWPAVVARELGVDTVNLGYAGAARGELASAEHVAALAADVVIVAFGTNCWSRVPHDAALQYEVTRAFVRVVRGAHTGVPLVVCSPFVRPDAERTPNTAGATLVELREAMERAVREMIDAGDDTLALVRGSEVLTVGDLVDGVHPGDAGHARIAAAVSQAVAAATGAAIGAARGHDAVGGGRLPE